MPWKVNEVLHWLLTPNITVIVYGLGLGLANLTQAHGLNNILVIEGFKRERHWMAYKVVSWNDEVQNEAGAGFRLNKCYAEWYWVESYFYPYLLEQDGKAAKIGAMKKGIWVQIKSRDSIYRRLASFLLSSSINTTLISPRIQSFCILSFLVWLN